MNNLLKKYISKKPIYIASCVFLTVAGGVFTSCTEGFEEANRPGKYASAEELARDNYTIGSFLIQMQNAVFPEQENDFQMDEDLIGNYLGRYMTYAKDGWSSSNFATMNAPANWVRYPFKSITPKFVSAFNEVVRLSNHKKDVNYAWALILRAQGYLRMTDKYGPFPIGAEKDKNAYSSQKDIYLHLINDLDDAVKVLGAIANGNEAYVANQNFDKVYHGKVNNWIKFANSLKLRMAIRMRFANPTLAKKYAEEAVMAGVITKNEDNCAITFTPHGLYKTSVEWGDSRACADIESYMTGYNDPRLTKYFKPTAEQVAGQRAIIGCRAGAKIGNKTIADAKYSAANVQNNTKGVWLTAAEMAFCRAEGALAGWQHMGGTAEQLYKEGIKLSFQQWEAGDATQYINNHYNQPAYYTDAADGFGQAIASVSNITVAWDENATEEQKLERIIVQKWIALFPNGQEGWNEIRRTGYPKVFKLMQAGAAGALNVANRIPFADTEITENAANLEKAKTLLGGPDDYTTMMWWQRARYK